MKYLILLSFLLSFNIYAECVSTPVDSATGIPTNAGINKLVEQNCDVTNPSHREVILNQQIISGENINSDSINLKMQAINETIKALSGGVNIDWITFGTDQANFTLTSSTALYATGSNNPYSVGVTTTKTVPANTTASISFKVTGANLFPIGFDVASEALDGQEFPEYGIFLIGNNYDIIKKQTWPAGSGSLPNGFDTVIKLAIEENLGNYEYVMYFDDQEIDRSSAGTALRNGVTAPFRFIASLGYTNTSIEILEITGFQ